MVGAIVGLVVARGGIAFSRRRATTGVTGLTVDARQRRPEDDHEREPEEPAVHGQQPRTSTPAHDGGVAGSLPPARLPERPGDEVRARPWRVEGVRPRGACVVRRDDGRALQRRRAPTGDDVHA